MQEPTTSPVTVKDLDELSKSIVEQREKLDLMQAAASEEGKHLARLEMKLASYLKDLGRSNYKSPYATISLIERTSYRLPATDEDRATFFDYLKAVGVYDRLVSVHSATLNSFAKEQQKIADEEGRGFDFKIPGLSAPTVSETVRVLKAKE